MCCSRTSTGKISSWDVAQFCTLLSHAYVDVQVLYGPILKSTNDNACSSFPLA